VGAGAIAAQRGCCNQSASTSTPVSVNTGWRFADNSRHGLVCEIRGDCGSPGGGPGRWNLAYEKSGAEEVGGRLIERYLI